MYFNSYNFILYFLPITLIGFYICGKLFKPAAAKLWLLAFSMLFCFSHGFKGALVILFLVFVTYLLAVLCSKTEDNNDGKRKLFVVLSILISITGLLILKYLGFFADVWSAIVSHNITVTKMIMPIGISYLTFRQIGFMVDIYKKELLLPSFSDYLLYCFYFPMLIQGPITLSDSFFPELDKEEFAKFNADRFAKGLYWISVGLFKKMFIADALIGSVTLGFSNVEALSSLEIVLVTLAYTFQLYFDFTGYCDMALGVSEMFTITLPINFNSPFKAESVGEIWRRWHITLSDFMKKYVYFPLGGSKKGEVRTYLNIIIVFFLSGFWHGANFTYIVWGLLNGIAQCFERAFSKGIGRINKTIRRVLTFTFWNFTVMIFKSESLKQAWTIIVRFFTNHSLSVSKEILSSAELFDMTYLESHMGQMGEILSYMHLPFYLLLSFIWVFCTKNIYEKEFKPTVAKSVFSVIALFWCILSMGGITTFLYALY